MGSASAKPPLIDRWTSTSLIASAIAMATLALVWNWPAWLWTWILVAGEAVFIIMMLRHPEHFYRRLATGIIGAAVGLALPPMVTAQAHLKDLGKFSLVLDSSPWLSVCLVVAAVVIIVLDWLPRSHWGMHSEPAAASIDPSPTIASSLVANPCFTGVVEAYIDGTVWRASMHTGSAAQADPVCPTHHVLMETRPGDLQGTNWYCTDPRCTYHRYMPKLAIFGEYDKRRKYLTYIYSEIERRVKEGTGYLKCSDEAPSTR
jgi:hypothetical protein